MNRYFPLFLEGGACQGTQFKQLVQILVLSSAKVIGKKTATFLGYPASALQQSKGWQGGSLMHRDRGFTKNMVSCETLSQNVSKALKFHLFNQQVRKWYHNGFWPTQNSRK